MYEDIAKDYSTYMNVDLNAELHSVEDTIEDMLTRLDEFENLVNMVRTDGKMCVDMSVPQILCCKEKLNSICDRIDRLEHFINRVKTDMEMMESKVEDAEAEIGFQNVGKFKSIFKPLFFKKSPTEGVAAKRSSKTPTYETHTLFTTSSYFPQSENTEQKIEGKTIKEFRISK